MKSSLLAVVLLAAPVAASEWTSYEQLQGASRVNLRGDLDSLRHDAGASWNGSHDASGFSSATQGAPSATSPGVEKPSLSRTGAGPAHEPPSPKEAKDLKLVRMGGLALAGGSAVWLGVALATGAAFPPAALGFLFAGALVAYLAHRRLQGKTSGIFG